MDGYWTFAAGAEGYISTPAADPRFGSANCIYDGENGGCLRCTGGFSFTLYAGQGNVEGYVIDLNTGRGVEGFPVSTNPYPPVVFADAAGHYSFAPPGSANPWGLPVYSDGSTEGRAVHTIVPGFNAAEQVKAVVTSSKTTYENFFINKPETLRCIRGPNSPPSNVGGPVNVTSGNVWLDQRDATIPGIAGITFGRSYNSKNAYNYIGSAFGRGWTHSYEVTLSFPSSTAVIARSPDGTPTYYQDVDGDLTYQAHFPVTERSWLVKSGSGFTRYFKEGGSETYDLAGRMLTMVDVSGNTTVLERGVGARLDAIVDPGGRRLTLTYDGSNRVATLSSASATLAIYAYDGANQLARVEYADGSGYTFTYDNSAQLLTVTDLAGVPVEAHEYSGSTAVTSEIADGREKYTLSYGSFQTTVTDALGNATVYEWANVAGQKYVTKITGPCSSCGGGTGETQEWTYDENGQVLSYKDGAGTVTTYTYDADGNLATETSPAGTTTYTYDSQARVLTMTAPGVGTTTNVYGPAGPTTITQQITETTSRTTSITYTPAGKPETITDPRGKITTLGYTAAGDLTSVTDPPTHQTTFGYDTLGRRTAVTDPLSHSTTTAYNARGRVTRITQHDGTHTDFSYDLGGRRTSVTDPLSRTTTYVYDTYGRLTSVIDPMSGTTRYAYDLMSDLVSLTDANSRTTTFDYDAYRRVKKVTYPGGAYEIFTYDTAGRLFTKVDRKNVTTTYGYDDLNRLTSKTYSDGTAAVSYTYDPASRLLTAANGTDSLTWTYDLAGQVLSEASIRNGSTVAYAYDLGGNRLSVSLEGSVFMTYAYDDASRLTTITRASNVFGFGYDNANRRTSLSYPSGVSTSYTYDDLNRLSNLSAVLGGTTTITQSGYAYDAAGNRTSKTHPDFTENYSYDPLYRLTGAERTGATPNHWLYTYDAVGNRLQQQIDSAVTTSTYDEKNRLQGSNGGGLLRFRGTLDEPGTVTVAGQPARMLSGNVFEALVAVTPGTNTIPVAAQDASGNVRTNNYQVEVTGSGASFTYDLNGNLTQKVDTGVIWTYEWNAENQLTRVLNNGSEVARFKYDPLGRRVEKVAGSTTTTWTYDGEDILREVSGATTLKYVHGPGLLDEPLAQEDGAGTLTYFHADGLGSVVKTTNASGGLVTSRRYDAFGSLELGATNGYAFTGREWDSETGLYYYRARYYDPKVARFMSEDPLRFVAGLNFYRYVGNRPTIWIDPDGLDPTGGGLTAGFTVNCMVGFGLYTESVARQTDPPSWAQAHCLASCLIKRHCPGGALTSKAAQMGKELQDVGMCTLSSIGGAVGIGTRRDSTCDSAFQGSDSQHNREGMSCPAQIDCHTWCAPLRNFPEGPPGFMHNFGR